MPNVANGRIADDPRRIEKMKLRLSSQLKSKGKSAMKDAATGFTPTDEQILLSETFSTSILPSVVNVPMPPVGDESSEGSCVSFGIGYYCFSAEYYRLTGATSYNLATNVFSPEYAFNYCAVNGCTGSTLAANLDLLKNKGICLWATLPYTAGTCNVSDASPHDAEAANYRISGYTLNVLNDRATIKGLLASGRPIYIGIVVDNAFYSANSSFIWSAATHNSIVSGGGQHAITICGYDDTKNAYKVVNEWGTSWGASGYSWVDYDFMESGVSCGYYGVTLEGLINNAGTPTLPFANAGFDTTVPLTDTNTPLDATASFKTGGYIKSYAWTQESGATVTLNNATAGVASVASWPSAGDYVFKVVVTDDATLTASDTVKYTVVDVAVPADAIVLSGTKVTKRGKVSDVLTWNIALAEPPQQMLLQISSTTDTGFLPLYLISFPNGTYTNIPTNTKKFRYYRVQVLKSDNTYAYSNQVALK